MSNILDPQNPEFLLSLEALLADNADGVLVANFLGRSWNVFYDLHNPENFEDPDADLDWYDARSCFTFYEEGFRDPLTVSIFGAPSGRGLAALRELIDHAETYEKKILSFFRHHTFGGGGAYAASRHFTYARRELEKFHDRTITETTFIERTICLNAVILDEEKEAPELLFHCGWDFEHGISIGIKNSEVVNWHEVRCSPVVKRIDN